MHGVMPCRSGPNEELRYALRSYATNAPWLDDVTLVGDPPDWYTGWKIEVPQTGTRYENSTAAVATACACDELPDVFVLLNDDFFALSATDKAPDGNRGPIAGVLRSYAGVGSRYARGMRNTLALLQRWGYADPLSFELHLPMTIDRAIMGDVLDRVSRERIVAPHKRSIYGAVAELTGPRLDDVKMHKHTDSWPPGPWISTEDAVFAGPIGYRIKAAFTKRSPWEASASTKRYQPQARTAHRCEFQGCPKVLTGNPVLCTAHQRSQRQACPTQS
jgi:hypothetical protein